MALLGLIQGGALALLLVAIVVGVLIKRQMESGKGWVIGLPIAIVGIVMNTGSLGEADPSGMGTAVAALGVAVMFAPGSDGKIQS